MNESKSKRVNKPRNAGSQTVEPIRKRRQLSAIKEHLKESPRNLALFVLGINAGLRGSDLLALRWADILTEDGGLKRVARIREGKTGNLRRLALGDNVRAALTEWLAVQTKAGNVEPSDVDGELLFPGKGGKRMTIQRLHQLVNEWAAGAGVKGHFGTHSLRKTYGYFLRKRGVDLPTLVKIFGHSSPGITLRYLGIDDDEIDEANLKLNL